MNVFQRNPKKTLVVFIVCFSLLIDFAAARIFSLIAGYPLHLQQIYTQTKVEPSYRMQSDVYHHGLAPMATGTATWGGRQYSIYTDSLGFRSDSTNEVVLEIPQERIVFIGDSFTEGVGVNYEESFVGRISDHLAQQGVDVLNAGAVSYSPIIYWRKTKYLMDEVGLKFDQLTVFIDISDIHDDANRYVLDADESVRWPEYDEWHKLGPLHDANPVKLALRKNTVLTYALLNFSHDLIVGRDPWQESYSHLTDSAGVGGVRGRWTIDSQLFELYGQQGLERAASHMDRLWELTQQAEVDLVIAVYPWPDQIIEGDLNSIQVEFWRNWARKRQIRLLNYFPCFIHDAADVASRRQVVEEYFVSGDIHWNAAGHKLIADAYIWVLADPDRTIEAYCRNHLK